MIWTKKQNNGTYRTIDTQKAGFLDLLIEWISMIFIDKDEDENNGKKQTRKNRK